MRFFQAAFYYFCLRFCQAIPSSFRLRWTRAQACQAFLDPGAKGAVSIFTWWYVPWVVAGWQGPLKHAGLIACLDRRVYGAKRRLVVLTGILLLTALYIPLEASQGWRTVAAVALILPPLLLVMAITFLGQWGNDCWNIKRLLNRIDKRVFMASPATWSNILKLARWKAEVVLLFHDGALTRMRSMMHASHLDALTPPVATANPNTHARRRL